MSRAQYPKQLMAPLGGLTLLQQTCGRLEALDRVLAPLIVCNEDYRFVVAEQLRALGKRGTVVLEPIGRNTAPALTAAALLVDHRAPQAIMLVMPSDHVIADVVAFRRAVLTALPLAEEGAIVTFGVVPDRPETGYGYIRHTGGRIEAFIEKPESVCRCSGDALWLSGDRK